MSPSVVDGGYDTEIVSFVNTIPTSQGGTHQAGFAKALTQAVNNVVLKDNRKLAKLKKEDKHKAVKDDVQEGLVAAIKVTFPEPQFRGQTKQELGTPAIESIVRRIAYEQLKEWFEPGGGPRSHVKAIADKLATAIQNRVASKQVLENKRKAAKLGSTGMPRSWPTVARTAPTPRSSWSRATRRRSGREGATPRPWRSCRCGQGGQCGQGQPEAGPRQCRGPGPVHVRRRRWPGRDFNLDDSRYGRIVIL